MEQLRLTQQSQLNAQKVASASSSKTIDLQIEAASNPEVKLVAEPAALVEEKKEEAPVFFKFKPDPELISGIKEIAKANEDEKEVITPP